MGEVSRKIFQNLYLVQWQKIRLRYNVLRKAYLFYLEVNAMSRILHDAVIQALKEAHAAYQARALEKYRDSMQVAQCGVKAIRSLGTEEVIGRQMELMGLEAEITLMHAMTCLHNPAEAIRWYEAAVCQMLLPPSRVIPKEAPMLPGCENPLDYFGGACEQTAEQLEQAARLYGGLTDGGGGGVAEIYRAQLAQTRGNLSEAGQWAQLALERMCGDKWIEPIAQRLLSETDFGRNRGVQPQR